MTETWLPISGYEGLYEVSSLGRVHSLASPRGDGIMRGDVDRYGYHRVLLTRDGAHKRFKVHRIVCEAFYGAPKPGQQVAHLDGIKKNNSAANLQWATHKENEAHKDLHGTRFAGSKHPRARLAVDQVVAIRAKAKGGSAKRALAREYGVSEGHIRAIVNGKRWAAEVKPPYGLHPFGASIPSRNDSP